MAGMIAIGVGCRKACASEAIVGIVRRALADCCQAEDIKRLFSVVDKSGEPGLRAAAETLGYDLVFLPREALAMAASRVLTHSPAAQRRFGLASIAEAAALAGAGEGAKLLAPRLAADGATCAIAFVPKEKSSGPP